MPPKVHFDLATIDPAHVLADREAIRKILPQRFEMEQLDAIVHLDGAAGLVVGYKDVRHDEFWVRGHMPGYPILPGVLMCEAAAQLCSYQIATETERDRYFTAQEAKEFGLVDDVLMKLAEEKKR